MVERERIEDSAAEQVVGGTIVFNGDCTTCGYFRNDQYKVLDFQGVLEYIKTNKGKMSERKMLNNLIAEGLLEAL